MSATWGTRRAARLPTTGPDHLPGPVRDAQPEADDPRLRGRAARRQRHRAKGDEREAKVIAALESAGLRPGHRLHVPLPARAVRRPAPTGRHRRCAGHGSRGHRRRRAGLDARRLDPDGASPADARPARRARPDLPVHHPRPVAGVGHRRSDRGDVSRQDHGDRTGRDGHPLPAQSVHPGARVGLAVARSARRRDTRAKRTILEGETPDAAFIPTGCRFHPRCPVAFDRCTVEEPPLFDLGGGQAAACWLAEKGQMTMLGRPPPRRAARGAREAA